MRLRPSTQPSGLTRRGLLQAGGLAGAAALVGLRPWAPAGASAAVATADGTPAHLLRSSWIWMKTTKLRVDGSADVDVTAVTDLPAASADADLAGAEDAFALTFSGAALEPGTHTFEHPELGTFDLFVGSGDAAAGTSTVVINRSVGALRHLPKPPQPGDARPGTNPHTGESADQVRRARRKRWLRRMRARRTARGFACTVVLADDLAADHVAVWLTRGKREVGAASARVKNGRAHVRGRTARRLRAGRYGVTAIAFGRDGEQHGRSERVTLD